MKGRPLSGEEFDRLIDAAGKVRKHDAPIWQRFLRGLWLSGLRLEEGLSLSWDRGAGFAVDLTGRRPKFRIRAAAEKGNRDRVLPMTPDFAELLAETPEAERRGRVFKVNGLLSGQPITPKRVSRILTAIGKRAGVKVDQRAKRDRETGEKVETVKYASAHDLRRSFGTRWAKRVMPAVLRQLMRHSSIETTMRYYVDLDADELADELWERHAGNTPGNTTPTTGQEEQRGRDPWEAATPDCETT
jgi:integrase